MRDRRYALAGLALLFLALAYPTWRAAALGTRPSAPTLAKARTSPCVLPPEEMRASHMKLLATWRDLAVRSGVRRVTMADGRTWRVSLSATCLDCHEKARFCDRCHDYVAVTPECWTCHVADLPGRTGVSPVGMGVSPRASGPAPAGGGM
jgi:hypothetical protein